MSGTYLKARLFGSDYHDGSIELARKRAADSGSERVVRGRVGSSSAGWLKTRNGLDQAERDLQVAR